MTKLPPSDSNGVIPKPNALQISNFAHTCTFIDGRTPEKALSMPDRSLVLKIAFSDVHNLGDIPRLYHGAIISNGFRNLMSKRQPQSNADAHFISRSSEI
jgi:hypothetical protein